MKTFFKNISSGFVVGIVALFTIIIGGTIYASLSSVQPGNTLTAEMWNNLSSNIEIPSGLVASFNLNECPNGWLPANGSGSIAGENIPDLRGRFIRGMGGNENGEDETRELGTYQADGIKEHSHSVPNSWDVSGRITRTDGLFGHSTGNGLLQTGMTGDSETRPKNIALIYCIKE